MATTRFIAILPKPVELGDKIVIKGTVRANASAYSINFANEPGINPENITYHFKWRLPENKIIEAYKDNGEWMEHTETQYNAFDGPQFALEFTFQDDGIYVYLVYGEGRNMITKYEPAFDISEIRSIQVWDDVDKVSQLTFLYH